MFLWVVTMLGVTACYPRCLNTLPRLGPGQPDMGWSLCSFLRHVAFYHGTVLSVKCCNPFAKHQMILSWHLTWKGSPSQPQFEQLLLGKHSTKNPITAPPTLNPLYNPNQTSPKPQPHTAFPLTLTNQTIPSCPPAAKVLQVLHQAWPWAAWHGMIFVQPLEACGFSLQWNCPINKMLQMILSWHSTWKRNPSHPQTEQLCVESKALKNL